MMYNLKNNSVVLLKKTSNWFARYAIVGQSRHVVLSFLLLEKKRVQWTSELMRCDEAQTALTKCSSAGKCRSYTFVLLTSTIVVTT